MEMYLYYCHRRKNKQIMYIPSKTFTVKQFPNIQNKMPARIFIFPYAKHISVYSTSIYL